MQVDTEPGETAAPIQNVSFSCKFCQALLEAAEAEDINNGCQRHGEFYDACTHVGTDTPILMTNLIFGIGKLTMNESHGDENDEQNQTVWFKNELLLVNEWGSKPGLGLGRTFDREFIDLALIGQWKESCVKHHGNKCSEKITRLNHPLLYLIDTRDMCLVKATDDMAYAALSYVWGQTPMLKTSRENVHKLQDKGSLVQVSDQLPATIRDAIKLVPLIGEHYLWIDSLCIIQDDEVSARLQIDQMAAIYEKAILTIVAADGKDEKPASPRDKMLDSLARGHREDGLCRRTSFRAERSYSPPTVSSGGRSLTCDEDVIPAFASTFGAMQKAFPRGFIHGLPVSFFDLALLWRSFGTYLNRRRGSRKKAGCPPRWTWAGWSGPIDGYSWSARTYMKDDKFRWGMPNWEAFQVIPLLTWSTKETKESPSIPIPFQNEYHDYKLRFMGEEHDLPAGWRYKLEDADFTQEQMSISDTSRHNEPDCQVTTNELLTYYYYEYDSCPEIKFWYPVPIGSADAGEEHRHIQYGRYLCAKTHQARLWEGRPHFDKSKVDMKSVEVHLKVPIPMFGIDLAVSVILKNDEGEVVGELSVDMRGDLERFWNDDQPPISVELQREPSPTAASQQTSTMSEVRDALLPDSLVSMDDGRKYWEGIDADLNGMLGGIPSVTRIDLQASRTFLARLGIGVKTGRKKVPRALEGGAGIGRVTEGLLLQVAEQVDVIEPVAKFTAVLEGKAGVGSIFNVGLEGWSPEEGVKYDLIWMQWCVGHLPDGLLVQYFERCKAALNPEGVIVIKENLSTSNIDEFDNVDSSVTRKDEKFLALFEQAGLKLVKSDMQRGFPLVDGRPLMPVKMYALKPDA
ncbi:duf858 domain-containing protein [Fusarium albosuccineum]|uniref:Alpha N-terminal protein methyltransferase 1 n=1 Tax=Fusarium albosuccineum TaxID=1237068 RepID=A0A8H4LDV3_9HYPO|nr:duf858 domain-containing protein [Fusarium albosuccineum]